jgi:hypothetical protein
LAHKAGTKFIYETTTGILPFLDGIIEAGVDLITGVDPGSSGRNDLDELARHAAGRIALSGGISFPHHLENGTPTEVRQAVARAIRTFGPHGGFILGSVGGPVYPPDKQRAAKIDQNMRTLIETWREMRDI